MQEQPFQIFAGRATNQLAQNIANNAGVGLGEMNFEQFADGEFTVSYPHSMRGAEVFIVQSTMPRFENMMELLLMVDAAKRASAKSVIAVIPYFGWARQDRKDKPRVAIGAKLVANLLQAAGIDRLMTMDLHADQIQGFFDVPVDHLYASSVLKPYVESLQLHDLVIASPDVGGAKRANSYAKNLHCPLVLCHKVRAKANQIESITLIGDVKDKDVILVDDIIDTAGTITAAANAIKEAGARSVRAMASHALMSGPACQRITDSQLEELIVTDSIPFDASRCPKVSIISVAHMFAQTINLVHSNQSISGLYNL